MHIKTLSPIVLVQRELDKTPLRIMDKLKIIRYNPAPRLQHNRIFIQGKERMLELSSISWAVVIACAVMIGFSKTGIPGTGILVAPLMAMVMPAKASTGFVLPMLAMADIMAIIYWRRHVAWANLLRLLPWTMVGVIIGYLIMRKITNEQLMPIIGVIVLALITVTWWRSRKPDPKNIPTYWWFAGGIGILAGGTSMMANAAGPVMIIYLLAMKSEKKEFVGTAA